MRFLIFARTGMGNEIVKSISFSEVITDVTVITRKEDGVFPHFDCLQLDEYCRSVGVNYRYVHEFDSTGALTEYTKQYDPDVIVVSTFNKILPAELIGSAKIEAVNFHPSLLPYYRGPNPTNWALICGESQTGLTVHRLTSEVDIGDVLLQERINIENANDGELRKRLFQLAGKMFSEFTDMIANEEIRATAMATGGSIYPGITSKKGIDLLRSGKFPHENIMRGVTPYPGMDVLAKEIYDLQK